MQTNCELLWTQVTIGYSNKLYISAYYRPHVGNQDSIDELNISLQKLDETTKDAEIWLIGDFNAPALTGNQCPSLQIEHMLLPTLLLLM